MERAHFTLRIADEFIRKLTLIAEDNSRTFNREISMIMRNAVNEFEREHGVIKEGE